jgi:hypothetical protein
MEEWMMGGKFKLDDDDDDEFGRKLHKDFSLSLPPSDTQGDDYHLKTFTLEDLSTSPLSLASSRPSRRDKSVLVLIEIKIEWGFIVSHISRELLKVRESEMLILDFSLSWNFQGDRFLKLFSISIVVFPCSKLPQNFVGGENLQK